MIKQNLTEYQVSHDGQRILQRTVQGSVTFIPDNDLGIASGYYEINDIVTLLRKHCFAPEKIHFIADMLEE